MYCFEYIPQRLLWHVLTIIVFWINSFCVLDFLSNSIADSVRIFKFPSSWFIFICFGCYFIFHSILAREHSMYHFCSFWNTWDYVCGLDCDVWIHRGSYHGYLEIIHSTRDPLILSLRYFSLGAEVGVSMSVVSRGTLVPGWAGKGTTLTTNECVAEIEKGIS